MGVMIRIKAGMDPSYPWKQMGTSERQEFTGERGAGYYLSAVGKGGEPVGTWVGEGLADLGIHDGDPVRREDFEPLYGQFRDLRDPTGQTYLGAPPRANKQLRERYQAKLAAEPGATARRRTELWIEARAQTPNVGAQYFDSTFSVDKTITLAHATATANAVQAQLDGDLAAAREWEARATSIWAEIEQSVRRYIAHVQRECGYVRTGHHGRRVDGVDAGRFEDAHEIPVAIFPQHTSRDGDPQLHVHILWLNRVKTVSDGQWRAIDSRALHRTRGAGASLAGHALESGLTGCHGFGWTYRPKSHARVIAGVEEKVIDAFSSRRTAITTVLAGLIEAYQLRHGGRKPDQRALWSMRQWAGRQTRKGKPEGVLDFARLLRDWETKSRARELGTLRELARKIWPARPGTDGAAEQPGAQAQEMTFVEERAAMAAGLANLQEAQSAWTRYDLIRSIGEALPDHVVGADQGSAWRHLERLAARCLAGEAGEEVVRLSAPQWPPVPESLRRADGESIYRPHGAEQYATRARLSMEKQLIADAQEQAAPRIEPGVCAKLLGTDRAQLESLLRAGAQAHDAQAGPALRLNQATAAFLALTSPRRAELIVGPAGTGKTYTLAQIAAAWKQAGLGNVYGLATTSAGRNVLTAAEAGECYNTAEFLGHLPGQREARGPVNIGEHALLLLDEATVTSMRDLSAVLRHARRSGAKVVIAGDHAQLAAVESGGGFAMMTRALGYVQLTDAVRFKNDWEGRASLGIRSGDVSALADYDQHARLHGGTYEQMTEQAARAYLADYLAGKDVVLTAYEHRECADLSRRVQEYLLRWGELDQGQRTSLQDGAVAYAGDLIIAGQNSKAAGDEPGRRVANGDILRIDSISGPAMTVRRLTDHDRDGERLWTEPFSLSRSYAQEHCDLGYARTFHSVEGDTVWCGYALVSEKRMRSGLYPAMTRGQWVNHVYAYPGSLDPGGSDVGKGPDPAPEIDRRRMLNAEQAGGMAPEGEHDPIPVLGRVLRREDAQLSASETRARALANADHLGVLWTIWQDRTRQYAAARYRAAVREHLPPGQAHEALGDTDDLWRSLRAAELAGQGAGQVMRDAVAQRDLAGARSVSAVLAARVRAAAGGLPPQLRDSWRDRIPQNTPEDQRELMEILATGMDDRQARIGQHAAGTQPLWATQALGDVPQDPAGRAEWERSAGQLGAYREMFGYDHPGQAIGPEPATTSPEARAEWHTALGAMAKVDGIDVRGLTDGQLHARRAAAQRETAWAPKYVGSELRLARKQAQISRVEATRHAFEARAAARQGDQDKAASQQRAAKSWQAVGARCATVQERFTAAQDTHREWEVMTEPTRRLGRAADAEARRRGIIAPEDKLRSAEPEGFIYPEQPASPRDVWVQERLDGGREPPQAAEPDPETDAEREQRRLEALGLTPGQQELPAQIDEIREYNRQRQREIDERKSQRIPAEDHEEADLGEAWTTVTTHQREAILQPPKPPIRPADAVMEAERQRRHPEPARGREPDMEPEAGS